MILFEMFRFVGRGVVEGVGGVVVDEAAVVISVFVGFIWSLL